ncbi:hypothetical protein PIROE2DRAFT_64447 [Piromyces sp. E2]|nr:hypothetical protein PIROE2DRAFT_64447 [Piromyces sp. E2]|eukprot:OUM58374.1 hypothetical protein PIROE2DRAFT_64447 [Piromyces sp. E2]
MDMEIGKVNGGIYYRIQDKNNKNPTKKVIYIHGGAFFLEALKNHWNYCYRLSKETGCEIIFPYYPLVPESSSEPSHNMLLSVYKELIKNIKPEDITIMGDSAGATLAFSLSMLIRDHGLPVPNEIILISPGFRIGDTTEEENKRLEEIKKYDFLLDLNDYRVDALKGNLHGLPRITMFSGTHDVLNIPARRLAERMKKEGHPYCYIEKEGGIHVYALSNKSKKEFELTKSRILGN